MYDILEPCYHGEKEENNESNSKLPLSFRQLGKTDRPMPVRKRMFGRAWPYRAIVKDGYVPSWPELLSNSGGAPPCVVSYFTYYYYYDSVYNITLILPPLTFFSVLHI